ncbi:hypothetical protein ACLOJK_022320 [Asimina triloba]
MDSSVFHERTHSMMVNNIDKKGEMEQGIGSMKKLLMPKTHHSPLFQSLNSYTYKSRGYRREGKSRVRREELIEEIEQKVGGLRELEEPGKKKEEELV